MVFTDTHLDADKIQNSTTYNKLYILEYLTNANDKN